MKYFFGKLVGFINGIIACIMGLFALVGCLYVGETIKSVENSKDQYKDYAKKIINDYEQMS